jgi:hypothetical protein
MNVFQWLSERFSLRGRALFIYQRGIARSKKRNHQGAIDDYTATIGMPDTPIDRKAMALYQRALAHVAVGDAQKGTDDLHAVVAMGEGMVNVRSMARQELVRMETRPGKGRGNKRGA